MAVSPTKRFLFWLCIFAVFLPFRLVSASTYVTADITADTVWKAANSPYIIEGFNKTITVKSGAILTIEPGVRVLFDWFTKLEVLGNIKILGDPLNKVIFDSLSGANTDWSFVVEGAGPHEIKNFGFRNLASYGRLSISDTTADLDGITSDETVAHGIFFSNSNATLKNSRFLSGGYSLRQYGGNLSISNSHFESVSAQPNVIILTYAKTTISDSEILATRNYVGDAQAVYIQSSNVAINNTKIDKIDPLNSLFSDGGIVIYDAFTSTRSIVSLTGDTITNFRYGIFAQSGSILIDSAKIGNNSIGIYVLPANMDVPVLSIGKSSLFGNRQAIDNESSNEVVARGNWWGDPSGPYQASTNPTGKGDPVSANVDYSGWLKYDPGTCCSSVAFIPGIEASRLYRQQLFENQLWEPNRNADVNKLAMSESGISVDGEIYTRDVIDESAFGLIDVYGKFIDFMNGLVDNGTIAGFRSLPYDWRFDLNDIVNKGVYLPGSNENISYIYTLPEGELPYMIKQITDLVEHSKNGKVTLIAHSNGGLVLKELIKKLEQLKTNGKSNLIDKIDKIILVAVPQLGTPAAIPALQHGYDQQLAGGFILSAETARDFAKNVPGAYNLLPSKKYFNTVADPVIKFDDSALKLEPSLAVYGSQISDFDSMENFLNALDGRVQGSEYTGEYKVNFPIKLNSELLSKSTTNHENFDEFEFPSNIQVTQIAGWGIPTLKGVEYSTKKVLVCPPGVNCFSDWILDLIPDINIDGDGTVLTPSSISSPGKVLYINLGKIDDEQNISLIHRNILASKDLDAQILNILNDSDTSEPYVTEAKPIPDPGFGSLILIGVHSPVNLNVIDSTGNHTGPISIDTSDIELAQNMIPRSSYFRLGESQYVLIPPGEYKVLLQGTENGTFSLDEFQINDGEKMQLNKFDNIPVTSQSRVELDISNQNLSDMHVDIDGNGTYDFIITPTQQFDPVIYLKGLEKIINDFEIDQNLGLQLINKVESAISFIQKGQIDDSKDILWILVDNLSKANWKSKYISDKNKILLVEFIKILINKI